MISKLKNWIKNNKLAFLVILVLGFLAFGKVGRTLLSYGNRSMMMGYDGYSAKAVPSSMGAIVGIGGEEAYYPSQVAPTPEIKDRMVVTDSNISVQVKNVTDTIKSIKDKSNELGGYVVNTYVNRPEFGEEGYIQVRVPTKSVEDMLQFLRDNSVKVVSENISGSDITDSYVDINERLTQLEQQKAMLNDVLKLARNVEEIMKVRPYLTQVQNEIDSYKGQVKYMQGASSTALITINLATDELGLPYTPVQSWRPEAIVKQAMRSLIGSLQKIGTAMIWLGVYSVLIVPALTIVLIIVMVKRRNR